MAKFICLTQSCGNDVTKPLVINADHIQHVVIGNKGKDVHVRMSDGTFFFVTESLESIKALIGEVPKQLQPIMVNKHEFDQYKEEFLKAGKLERV